VSGESGTIWRWVRLLLAAASVSFHLYLIFSGLIPNLVSRPIHLALALPWVFFDQSGGSPAARIAGALLGAAGIICCLYIAIYHNELGDQYGFIEGGQQYLLAVILIAVVLEMARRAVKAALPAVALIALSYAFFGQYLPGEFGHPGIPVGSILGTMVIAEGGIWGSLTGVSVNVVAVFVILGAMIGAGDGGTSFMSLATRLAGRYRAGAAKVSVLSSAFFGSISGSASANVASTGAITLPTMKRLGYRPVFAAAVEAVASSGGQIMPPLMGAGAFVMMELLRAPYLTIVEAALLPALLFFFTAWVGVDMYARRHGLKKMADEDIPTTARVLRLSPFFLIPFSLLLLILFFTSYTPQFAAGIAIFAATALLITDEHYTFSMSRFARRLVSGIISAAQQIGMIASIIICAGIIIGVLHMTGLGVKVTSVILGLSGGKLWVALLLTALACLILGMEVPTTAAYIICVSVAGPVLQNMGLSPLQSHLFVFWYALLSTITPPVCGTVFIAAGMAQAPWLPVATLSMRIGLGLYLVPLAFVANPALLQPASHTLLALAACAKISLGLWLVSKSLLSAVSIVPRIASLAAGIAVIFLFGISM
jgi:TRAP transporter 4TM/12TM fusion protein